MADVKIRNLDESVVNAYKRRAAMAGRSLEAELRETLQRQLTDERAELIDKLEALRADMPASALDQQTSTVEQMRDAGQIWRRI
jgi:antitoxin FitA